MIRVLAAALLVLLVSSCASSRTVPPSPGEELIGASSAAAFTVCAQSIETRTPTSEVWAYRSVQFDEHQPGEWTIRGVVAYGMHGDVVEPFECTVDGSATQDQ